jgi:hypothetical protein
MAGSNTNFIANISGANFDLNSLFVSSSLKAWQNNNELYYGETNKNLLTETFSKAGNYMVFITATPFNTNSQTTNYQLSFSNSSAGLTAWESNSIYITDLFGGDSNNTVSGCGVVTVQTNDDWYLHLKINGTDDTKLGVTFYTVGPI